MAKQSFVAAKEYIDLKKKIPSFSLITCNDHICKHSKAKKLSFVLLDLILYVPVNNRSVMSGHVNKFIVLKSSKNFFNSFAICSQ